MRKSFCKTACQRKPDVLASIFCAVSVLLTLSARSTLASTRPQPQDAREIVKRSLPNNGAFFKADPRYVYTQDEMENSVDASGRVTKSKHETFEVFTLFGKPYEELTAHDGKPLAPKEQVEQKKKLDQEATARRFHREDRAKIDREKRDKERREQIMAEIPNAFDFTLQGKVTIAGRSTLVVSVVPRPDYHSSSAIATRFLHAMRGTLWIDETTGHWVRIVAHVQDDIEYGLVLARVAKGASIEKEDVFVNNEAWLPRLTKMQYDARIALVRHLHEVREIRCDNYRKVNDTSLSIQPVSTLK